MSPTEAGTVSAAALSPRTVPAQRRSAPTIYASTGLLTGRLGARRRPYGWSMAPYTLTEKVPGSPYCTAHAASLCKWKIASRTYCAALAHEGSYYCKEHCCAVENDDGYRCPEPRCMSGFYCDGHRCAWMSAYRVRCERSAYNNPKGTCSVHMCVVEGCERRAENNANRCENHLCAYCFINPENGAKGEFPYCYHPPAEPGPYCQTHQAYMDSWAAMVEFEPWRFGYV
ncbi:hypothetical protein MFIFM68171_04229 [Madurella fahalii]|uniref:Uncharacterized protein n=1 Tax=Madurella fahalii TaxID=1157608 RepID=A0ABQ0G8B6_9PEZI